MIQDFVQARFIGNKGTTMRVRGPEFIGARPDDLPDLLAGMLAATGSDPVHWSKWGPIAEKSAERENWPL